MSSSNENVVDNSQWTSKDYTKALLDLQSATVQDTVTYLLNNGYVDATDIPKATEYLSTIKGTAVTSVLAWDTSKSTDDNIAYLSGTLMQDAIIQGISIGVVSLAGSTAALPVFVTGLLISEAAKQAGIDLGQEFENVYNYAQDFQATNAIETQRFETLKTTNPEAYQNMVQSGVFPQNTTQWNAHVNELTKDLYSRKAENLKSTISYDKSATINDNTTLFDIAKANGLTEKQILDYNNLNIKPDDYGNIQTGTKIAIPNQPEVSDGVTIYTDSEGNQKIISVDTITGKETVFYYNAKDYSLLEINGNTQTYNKVNADGSISTQKLGLGSIEVINSNNSVNNITVKNISDVNHQLIYDSNSSIHPNTQLEVLLRQNTNNNLSLKDLAHANGYGSEAELREAFKNGEVITTPTKQLISTDEYGNRISEFDMGNNVNDIKIPTFETMNPRIENGNYIMLGSVIPLQPNQTISHIASKLDGINSNDLLEYNNLSQEEAKSLPVGYEVQIPKSVKTIEGGYGIIKEYESYDGSTSYYVPNQYGSKDVVTIDKEGNLIRNDVESNYDLMLLMRADEQSQEYVNAIDISKLERYASSGQIMSDASFYDPNSKTLSYLGEDGETYHITYDTNNDLLIYGDINNPQKITFTDESGDYQVWERDKNGEFVRINTVDYSVVTNTAINQIGSLIIANNQDFSNIEKIVVSTSVATIADFATYKDTNEFNTTQEGVDNLKGAIVSFAVSSYFAKNDNISDLLGMDGTFLGDLADFTVSFTTSYSIGVLANNGFSFDALSNCVSFCVSVYKV